MYLADYHTHSKYSFDGCEAPEEMCQQAIRMGLSELAITDHMDIYTGRPYGELLDFDQTPTGVVHMDVAGLYRELRELKDRYAGRLRLVIGSELGQPQVGPEAAAAFLRDYPLDFVIGSVHNMEGDRDVYYYDFGSIDIPAMYDHYLDWLITLAKIGDFDIMGHLTYPLRYAFEQRGLTLDLAPYEEKFRYLFKLLTEKGRGIEVNVSGYYKAMKESMPPLSLVKLYRECGGELITIGSDAHKKQYIGCFQREGRQILQAAGFKYITTYEERRPSMVPLD